MGPPLTTWVFIVGHCEEWEDEERSIIGDRGLYYAFLRHLPHSQIVYVKNEECTRSNCHEQFRKLLEKSQYGDLLLFYYGGHGLEEGLATIKGKWFYKDIVELVERHYRGDKIWFLLDCCYSGSLSKHLPDSSRISYLSLASQVAHWAASDYYWSMVECMVTALLYDGSEALTIEDIIEYMADHHAVKKFDWFQATFHGKPIIQPKDPFPFTTWQGDVGVVSKTQKTHDKATELMGMAKFFASSLLIGSTSLNVASSSKAMPQLEKLTELPPLPRDPQRWKRLVGLQPGDKVYGKWRGPPQPGDPYLLPMYYEGTILKLDSSEDEVEVELRHKDLCWSTWLQRGTHLLPAYCFFSHEHNLCKKAHVRLAKDYSRYADASIPVNTRVWGMWENKVYAARIMEEPPWKTILKKPKFLRRHDCQGPFVWVEWEDEDEWDFLPRSHVLVQKKKPSVEDFTTQPESASTFITAEDALIRSMKSMGRVYDNSGKETEEVICWWNGSWRKATKKNSLPPLHVMIDHLDFDANGVYCCIQWENDKSYTMVPEILLKAKNDEANA